MRVDRLCLLSIDPARSSGWAIWAGRVLHDSGTALTAQDRADVVERWLLLAATRNLVRAVVAESWSPGMLSHATMFGCGAAYGRWLERIEDSGYREDHILRYMPAQWRKIAGIRSRGRVACKAEAIRTVARLYDVVADEARRQRAEIAGEHHGRPPRPPGRHAALHSRANALLDGLYKLLAETLVDTEHPVRGKIEEGLATLADNLLHDPEMQQRVRRLKTEVLANPAMGIWLDGMWERLRASMLRAAREPGRDFFGQFGASLGELGEALQKDERLQLLVNRFVRRTVVGMVTRYGDEIVRLVSETVRRWDAQTVTDRIEGAVGRDLQFIRINGTLVGGSVGLFLHAVTTFF